MIQFTPKGTYEEAVLYIDTITAAIDKVEARHAGFYVESLGVSTEKAIDAEIKGGLAKAGLLSIPLTIIILLFVLGSLVGALIPLLLGLTSVVATSGLLALSSQGIPASESIMEVVLLVGLAVGVDYSLFYMRREREERARRPHRDAPPSKPPRRRRAGPCSSPGITVLIAMAGMFLSGDKTFMSFSVGTMIVVAVAMIGSLTVLPALLGRLGDKVEKGRIPFTAPQRRADAREPHLGRDPRPRAQAPGRLGRRRDGAVLVALALPTLSCTPRRPGIEGFSTPVVEPFETPHRRLPGHP